MKSIQLLIPFHFILRSAEQKNLIENKISVDHYSSEVLRINFKAEHNVLTTKTKTWNLLKV